MILGDWDEVLSELPARHQTDGGQIIEKPVSQKLSFVPDMIRSENLIPEDIESFSLRETIKKIQNRAEKEIISYVLDKTGWNRRRAAKILKVSYRTLLYKIGDHNLVPPFTP
jgi:two-component system response regulator AtoC